MLMDSTTDPAMRSWVEVPPDSHFPIQNLPFGMYRPPADSPATGAAVLGVAIGEHILNLRVLAERGLFDELGQPVAAALSSSTLDDFLAMGRTSWTGTRQIISRLLRADVPTIRDDAQLRSKAMVHQREAVMQLPASIPNYTDFYSSREHATNVGTMLRGPANALQPNWLHLPVAYHGRASSIVVSGTDLHRPCGQTKADDAPAPTFGPSRNLDFELEMGFFVGPGNELGKPIPIAEARAHIFGMVLVNDWSARDIQKWEYVPLGPFLAKNFGTSISPWVVTLDALEPFRSAGPVQDPAPLPYLQTTGQEAYDIQLEVYLQTAKMDKPHRISASNAKHLYWNICQQLAHHTVNGCNMQPGDLVASGTISGPIADSCGSMLELAWKGTRPIPLPSGETRVFLQDGDRVTMTGWCQGPGYRVGFGDVTGQILPART
jgi:fumarylacetoacetase